MPQKVTLLRKHQLTDSSGGPGANETFSLLDNSSFSADDGVAVPGDGFRMLPPSPLPPPPLPSVARIPTLTFLPPLEKD